MNVLRVLVENITEIVAAGYTVIRVYTDTSETGTFTTLDGTVTLVAGTESYLHTDLAGTSATWYKTAYFGAVPGEGTKAAARRGESSAAYATVDELRQQVQKSGLTDDVELALILDAVSDSIDKYCNRPDGFVSDITASARTYAGDGGVVHWMDECTAITLVEVKDSASDTTYTAWAAADWIAATGDPTFPDFNRTPYQFLIVSAVGDYDTFTSGQYTGGRGFRPASIGRAVPTVRITANWGYSATVPPVIKQACIAQTAMWYKRGQSAWATDAGGAAAGRLSFRRDVQVLQDPDVRLMLDGSMLKKPSIGRRF